MQRLETGVLSEAQFSDTVSHYIEHLNLPQKSDVLLITDLIPPTAIPDTNRDLRRNMAMSIQNRLRYSGKQITTLMFDETTEALTMYEQTMKAFHEFHSRNVATLVYLGDSWPNRGGIYSAAKTYAENRTVHVAGSMGFTTGDARVLSHLDHNTREKLERANTYFESFFKENPKGEFFIVTSDSDGKPHELRISYNTAKAPFVSSMGVFDGRTHIDEDGYAYTNVPSGEMFCAPFPYNYTSGEFVAQGIVFTVEQGMITDVSAPQEVFDALTNLSQKELIRLVKNRHHFPVAELGLGFYELAGIPVYPDSSILTLEKRGPHLGIGRNVSKTTQAEVLGLRSGTFYHTDFVLDKPLILYMNPSTRLPSRFYPISS